MAPVILQLLQVALPVELLKIDWELAPLPASSVELVHVIEPELSLFNDLVVPPLPPVIVQDVAVMLPVLLLLQA